MVLWTHTSIPINFTLVVNDFQVKYSEKENTLHLKKTLEDKYKVTTYWEGKMFIGIALKWEYEKFTVQISISGYICVAQHYFQHKKNKITHDSPYPWTQPIYEK